ncbi:MAG: trehalose-phosphatase [Candidatus Acetothermia bacterium]
MTKLLDPEDTELREELLNLAKTSGSLLLCCDFDGTLVDFTGIPSATELPEEAEKLLNRLAGLDDLHLAVISGRGFEELVQLVPVENATLAGNHGLKIRFEDGTTQKPELAEEIREAITGLNEEVQEKFGDLEGIIIENKGFGLALHYRQYGGKGREIKEQFYQLWEDHRIPLLEVLEGAKLLEVRPANWNKGDAVKLLRDRYGLPPTIYIGDDTTDEDAFTVLNEVSDGFPILVSGRENEETSARYRLKNPEDVLTFLNSLYVPLNGLT